ncbi:homeobox protein PKNOX2-like [Coccinella septempunctata]|uniref:homeobox protein PKNOX2-like n=1 Tax=Coccinella septempunctata TaxID=41139 RepID=UPI001D05EB06|nr:homeobox protein PKNOX2-like [Coccinella septempunctata]XP_044763450.1 homeobox protein PKNOX2-like [Coccinella septempunctata]
MDCGIQSAILSVAPGADPGPQPGLTTSVFAPPDVDQAQFEADKRSVYKHPLFPLLALLFERCELATQSSDAQSSEAFNLDIQAFVQHQERDRKPFLANEPEIDGLMIKAIQVLRIHLLELEKVQELCKDFCNRYITCLKGKMQSENLLRSDYPQDISGASMLGGMESNNNSMMSHGNSESGSASNSPVQYSISPSQQQTITPQPNPLERHMENQNYNLPPHHYGGPTPAHQPQQQQQQQQQPSCDNLVVHGSTPLSQIGVNIGSVPPSESSGPLSPAPTTPGGSADDCDSDFTSRGGRKQKRGVLPKQATSVMRSWLFQHLVHPYPTEDEKRHIAAQTNLTLLQVNNWFINARRRILQPMLDASAPNESNSGATSPSHRKKKSHNNNRRFWSQDFANMQPQIASGMLSSSEDEGDSYSSDGEGSLVIDANAQGAEGGVSTMQNSHQVEALTYANGAEAEAQ